MVAFSLAGPLHCIPGHTNHNKRNSSSRSVNFHMSLAYEMNQESNFFVYFTVARKCTQLFKYNTKASRHKSKNLRANRAERVAEIMYRAFRIEKITDKRTQPGEANQTGTEVPTWPKPTRRWIFTSIKPSERRGKFQETCLWKPKMFIQ